MLLWVLATAPQGLSKRVYRLPPITVSRCSSNATVSRVRKRLIPTMWHGDPSSQKAKDFQPPTRMKRPTMGFAACLGQRERAVWACTCGQAALRRSRSACHSIAQGCCQGFRVLMLFLIQNPTKGLQEKAPFVYSHNCYKRTR